MHRGTTQNEKIHRLLYVLVMRVGNGVTAVTNEYDNLVCGSSEMNSYSNVTVQSVISFT